MEEWLLSILSQHGEFILYFGTFGLLVICGLGVPIPEELTFLCAGFAASQIPGSNIWLLCVMGVAGIMIGDSFPFLAGKYWGMSLLRRPRFAKIITPQRIEKVEDFFRRYGPWTVFGARFVAGLRMPTFFISATMGVKYWTFFVLDLLGALISCPTSIYIAYKYGPKAKEIVA
ncbi:MAG TPA: DedA family protein, partial [Planctomycetota bacterium]|nr:DedA family protein [Planctomycetota bacterium]